MSENANPILAIVIALLVGLLVRSVANLLPRRLQSIPLPYTATILLIGTAIGAVIKTSAAVAYATESLATLESIAPNLLFTIFLPALIMPAGLHLQWHVVRLVMDKALLLAIPGTMVNAAATALVARYILPYDWPWSGCWLFGGTLAATDPVATVAIIKSLGIAPKLATIIDGEALLNDGVAFVMFVIFREWAIGQPLTVGGVIGYVAKSSIAGPALSLAWAGATILWLTTSYNDGVFEVSLSVVAAYSLWIVTDEMVQASGLLALVVFATALGAYGKARVSRSQENLFLFFWDWVDWIANTLIFFLSGLITAVELLTLNTIRAADWGWATVIWLMLLVIRILMTVGFYPLLASGVYGIDWRDAIVVSWSGLRGAVGLTLALMVYYSDNIFDETYRQHFIFFVAYVATITLLVQGSSTSLLLKVLGYTQLPKSKRETMLGAARAVERMGLNEVAKAKKLESLLGPGDWEKVSRIASLNVTSNVQERPAGRLLTSLIKLNARRNVEQGLEAVVDLRERLLQSLLSFCRDAFSKGYLGPDEFEILEGTVEKSVDFVHQGLKDWENLEKRLVPLDKLVQPPAMWSRLMFWKWREGQVQRDAALCAVYAYSHAEARRDLETFMRVQILHHEETSDVSVGSRHSSGSFAWRGVSPSRGRSGLPDTKDTGDNLRAHWLDFNVETTRQLVEEAIKDQYGDAENGSDLWRTSAMNDTEAQHELDVVLDESRAEQALAENHLRSLRDICPEPIKDLRTKQVAVDVLKQEKRFLDQFNQAGLLDNAEVGPARDKIQRRLQWLDLAGFWGFLPGMRKLEESNFN